MDRNFCHWTTLIQVENIDLLALHLWYSLVKVFRRVNSKLRMNSFTIGRLVVQEYLDEITLTCFDSGFKSWLYLEKPLQFSYKIGSGGVEECNASLLQLYAWRVKCRERAKAIKMRVTRLLSISHIVQFLGWKEKREAVFINIPTIPFPLSVNLCGKKERKKSFFPPPMCHNHSLSRKNIKRKLSSQPFQFLDCFPILLELLKKVLKNFCNSVTFFQIKKIPNLWGFTFFLNSLLMYMFYCSAFLASIGPFWAW